MLKKSENLQEIRKFLNRNENFLKYPTLYQKIKLIDQNPWDGQVKFNYLKELISKLIEDPDFIKLREDPDFIKLREAEARIRDFRRSIPSKSSLVRLKEYSDRKLAERGKFLNNFQKKFGLFGNKYHSSPYVERKNTHLVLNVVKEESSFSDMIPEIEKI